MKQNTRSILDRIKSARTMEEVDELLEEGESLRFASPVTKRKWWRKAIARKAILKRP